MTTVLTDASPLFIVETLNLFAHYPTAPIFAHLPSYFYLELNWVLCTYQRTALCVGASILTQFPSTLQAKRGVLYNSNSCDPYVVLNSRKILS